MQNSADLHAAETHLASERDAVSLAILRLMLWGLLCAGPTALIGWIAMGYSHGDWVRPAFLITVYTAAVAALVSCRTAPSVRGAIVVLLFYVCGVFLMVWDAPYGIGVPSLLATVVLSGFLLSKSAARLCLAVTVATVSIIVAGHATGLLQPRYLLDPGLVWWFWRTGTFVLLALVVFLPQGYIVRHLVRSLARTTRDRDEIAASEARFRIIFHSVSDAIFIHDIDSGKLLDVNDATCRMYKCTRQQIIDGDIRDFSLGDSPYGPEEARQWIAKAAAGEPQAFEWLARDTEGRLFWVEVNIRRARIGQDDCLVVTARDIDRRKKAEEALRRSEAMLSSILNSVPQSIFWKDRDSVYFGCNAVFAKAVGLDGPEQIVGKTDFDLPWSRTEADAYRADDREVMERKQAKRHIVEPLQQADGTRLWIDTTKVPLLDAAGNPYAVLGVYEDITERKHAEETLRLSEQRYRVLCEATFEGIAITESGKIIDANDQLLHMLGRSREQAVGMDVSAMVAPEDLDRVTANILQGRESFTEHEVIRENGSRFTVEAHGKTVDYQDRRVRFTAIRDVTERRRLMEQLQRMNVELEARVRERTAVAEERATQLRMLAGRLVTAENQERRRIAEILHEHFQQLLVSINYNISVLRRRLEDKGLLKVLDQMSETIGETVQASRTLTVELCPPVLYNMGLAAGLEWLGRWMQDRYDLHVNVSADPKANPQAEDMSVLLFHSTKELLFNIVKHAGVKRASVRMIRLSGDSVEILVADEGGGFDPSSRPSKDTGAAGFGLFSIRERMELAGGRMQIDSSPGAGTRITLLAPLRASESSGEDILRRSL